MSELKISPPSDWPTDLYVSPTLDFFEIDCPHALARDFGFGRPDAKGFIPVYRRIDRHYYCWLRGQIDKLGRMMKRGKVSCEVWGGTLDRLITIEKWLLSRIPEKVLLEMRNKIDVSGYEPPGKRVYWG